MPSRFVSARLFIAVAALLVGCAAGGGGDGAVAPTVTVPPSSSVAAPDLALLSTRYADGLLQAGHTWTDFPAATAFLRGPHFGLRLASSTTATELSQRDLASLGLADDLLGKDSEPTDVLRAPPGTEFLMAIAASGPMPHYGGTAAY